MRISPISNNAISYKGYLTMYGPSGKTKTVTPEQVHDLSEESIYYYFNNRDVGIADGSSYKPGSAEAFLELFAKMGTDPMYNSRIYRHDLKVSKVTFDNSKYFLVNATNEELLNAIRVADKLPANKCVKVGEPLYPMIKILKNQKVSTPASNDPKLAELGELTLDDLTNYPNTINVVKAPSTEHEKSLLRYDPEYRHQYLGLANCSLVKDMEDEGEATTAKTSLIDQLRTSPRCSGEEDQK